MDHQAQGSVRPRQDVGPFTGPQGISLSCLQAFYSLTSLLGESGWLLESGAPVVHD